MTAGFVCAINGRRDNYQVPLALHQAGLLRRFVTDYYAPDSPPGWLPAAMAGRRHPGLPASLTANSSGSFLTQQVLDRLGVPMNRVFPYTDRMLGNHALRLARRLDAHLYCYAGYIPHPGRIPRGMKVIDFEFHPAAAFALDLLCEDAARYPEVAWSFAHEEHNALREYGPGTWRQADAVVCASRMTALSLEHAGCDPAQITVIPYGFDVRGEAPKRDPAGPARFLFVGQGLQRKGLHHLLRAWRQIDPARAQLTLVCYAIDPGIAALADQAGVQLLGRQERPALEALMRASDVFVMPSLIEGFGLVYLEALAAGCHVIATSNTGLPDLPLSDAARTLVPVGDIPAITAAIEAQIDRRARGQIDPAAISREAAAWSWDQFRSRIAQHAAQVLA